MKRLLLVALAIPALGSFAAAAPSSSISVKVTRAGRVVALAADGDRAAVMFSERGRRRILAWEPKTRRLVSIHRLVALNCSKGCGPGGSLALAKRRVAWDEFGGGNELETTVSSASIERHTPVSLGSGRWDWSTGTGGDEAFGPIGDENLLVFTIQIHCGDPEEGGEPPCPAGREPDDVVEATEWRVARRGRCPSFYRPLGHCARVARVNGQLTAVAVDAGRIAARTDHGIRLLTARGQRLRDLPVEDVRAAELSADRLALRVPGGVEVYDTGSGRLVRSFPVAGSARLDRLEDLDSGILVTAMGRTVTLRRLRDGWKVTMQSRGIAHAQLEPAGLFVAGGRRVTFRPRRDVLRMLDAGEQIPSSGLGAGR